MKFRLGVLILCIGLTAAFALALFGCADMPIIDPPPGEDKPIGEAQVVLGPYLTSADGMQPYLRFVSSRRTVAGIQSLSSSRKYINRQGSFSLFHSLAIPELSDESKPYHLWLGDQDGGKWGIRGLPKSGNATAIGFAGGSVIGGRLRNVGNQLRRLDPNAVVFTTPPFPGGSPDQPVDWENLFFAPLGDKVALGPMWFTPGSTLPKDLFPENNREGGYWKRDLGSVRIIGLDARAFSFDSSREAALDRLRQDLDPLHMERAWTVVVLSRSAFDARVGDGRILTALGDILEKGGVDLVIGHGDYYLRTRPFSMGGVGQTRYISIADQPADAPAQIACREYVEAISGIPHVARLWCDEGTLEWQVFDLAGRPLDLVTLDSQRRHLVQPFPKEVAMQDAQAKLVLQREVLKITRQAARAVPNPQGRNLLTLTFGNPTNQSFSGIMEWDLPKNGGWQIDPLTMPFNLNPGQSAAARFAVVPGNPAVAPVLTVRSPDVGSASDPLYFTQEKRFEVQKSPEAIRVDGRFRNKLYWNTLPVLTGFRTLEGRQPVSPTEARIAADQDGLIIAMSMAAKNASAVNPPASDPETDRDGPVLEDESVEIFLDPYRDGREYYHFAINPRNVVLDASSRAGTSYNPAWRRITRFGRVDDIETWDTEIRIPWEALGMAKPPAPGDEWGMQLVRRDYAEKRTPEAQRRGRRRLPIQPEISQWVPSDGDNTRPGIYGIIRFADLSEAPEAGDSTRRAPRADGLLIRGGNLPMNRLPVGRLPDAPGAPGGFMPPPSAPIAEPPPPDMEL